MLLVRECTIYTAYEKAISHCIKRRKSPFIIFYSEHFLI